MTIRQRRTRARQAPIRDLREDPEPIGGVDPMASERDQESSGSSPNRLLDNDWLPTDLAQLECSGEPGDFRPTTSTRGALSSHIPSPSIPSITGC
jgi:hypothetical protein